MKLKVKPISHQNSNPLTLDCCVLLCCVFLPEIRDRAIDIISILKTIIVNIKVVLILKAQLSGIICLLRLYKFQF